MVRRQRGRPVRIVFLQIAEYFGGSTRSLVEVATRLNEHEDVSVVDVFGTCGPFCEAVTAAGLDYHVLSPGGRLKKVGARGKVVRRLRGLLRTVPTTIKAAARAQRLLTRLHPSVIISSDFRSILPLQLRPALRRLPVVVYLRGWWRPEMLAAYSRYLARKRCAAMIAVSRPTKLAMVCAGVDPGKIHAIHNPIDAESFAASAARELDAPLPQADCPVRLLMPATLIRSKGQHTAIQALRRIVDAGHDAVLWLAGDLTETARPYVAECTALAERLAVADRVEWLGLRRDVPQVMSRSTAVVLPSWSEGHPRVALEAGALGKPLVATPVGGVTDMVLHRVTGMLFEVEDDRGLARCVIELAEQPELVERIGRASQQHVRENFRPEQQTQKILRVLRGITACESYT